MRRQKKPRSAAATSDLRFSSPEPVDPFADKRPRATERQPHPDRDGPCEVVPALVWQDLVTIRYIMWNYSGLIRTFKRLERAKADLDYLRYRIVKFYQSTEQAVKEALSGIGA